MSLVGNEILVMEIDRRAGKAKWLWLPIELLGISQMDTCYLNTQDQKNRVLR